MKKLISDQNSNFKGRVYGKANERIKIISEHGNMAIVEGETGTRFSTLQSNIADAPDEETKEKKPAIDPVKVEVIPRAPARPQPVKIKKVVVTQPDLFSK